MALVLGITVILSVLFGALYVQRVADTAREDFYSITALTAQIFAESIRPEASVDEIRSITQGFVRGDVLFAQVVRNGLIVFEDRVEQALQLTMPMTDFEGFFARTTEQFDDGTPYVQILRPFTGSSAENQNFVRLGFSLREIENRTLSETLFVIRMGVVVVLLMAALMGLSMFLLSRQREKEIIHGTSGMRDPFTYDPEDPSSEPSSGAPEHASDGTSDSPVSQTVQVAAEPHEIIEVGPLSIDSTSKLVSINGEAVELSPKEFELVSLLAGAPGRVFSNSEILEGVWPDGYAATSKDVKQYIYLLRRKLEPDPENPSLIVTVRGFGYKLDSAENGQS